MPYMFCSAVNKGDGDGKVEKKSSETMAGGYNYGAPKPGSGVKKALSQVNTHFYVGSEDGEIVYVDWMPQKDQDSGKIQSKMLF